MTKDVQKQVALPSGPRLPVHFTTEEVTAAQYAQTRLANGRSALPLWGEFHNAKAQHKQAIAFGVSSAVELLICGETNWRVDSTKVFNQLHIDFSDHPVLGLAVENGFRRGSNRLLHERPMDMFAQLACNVIFNASRHALAQPLWESNRACLGMITATETPGSRRAVTGQYVTNALEAASTGDFAKAFAALRNGGAPQA